MACTKKLYYENVYVTSFTATVTGCTTLPNGYGVTLSETLFYPEGGGQPADIGYLGAAAVLDVYERDAVIIHRTDKPLAAGETISGEIDWNRRFSLMQQHTGEHILSGLIHSLFKLDNVGFHMGKEYVTIDINGVLSEEELSYIEKLANQAVYKNIPVETDKDGRDLLYRSKKELTGAVRVVSVPGYDTCACCGLHCAFTGEIGSIKLLTAQKYKGGMRIYLLCGEKARQDYYAKNKSVYAISSLLSVKTDEVTQAVAKLLDENTSLKRHLTHYQKELFRYKVRDISEGTKQVCLFEDNCTPHALRQLCTLLCERVEVAAVFSSVSEGEYKYALGSQAVDVRSIGTRLNAVFNGRGGGQKALVQGTVFASEEEIKAFMAKP